MIIKTLARFVSRGACIAILSAVSLVNTAAADDANVADYSIASVEYLPSPLEKIGKLQAGLLCPPKGKLRWRDVARPEHDAVAKRLTKVLGDGGLLVAPRADPLFGDPVPLTRYRVKVVVERVKMRLCIAGLGIGEKQPSGEGITAVRWDTYDRVARGTSSVISDALVESARRYAVKRSI